MSPHDPIRHHGALLYGNLPATLVVLGAYTVAAASVLWWFEGLPAVVRIPLALPILLFTPGYAVVSAVFPEERRPTVGSDSESATDRTDGYGLSALERGILAVVASIAIVPGVALLTSAVVGVQIGPILAGLVAVTVAGSAVGIYERPDRQVRTRRSVGTETPAPESSWTSLLTRGVTPVAVALVLVLLVSSAAISIADGGDQRATTEFYLTNGTVADRPQAATSAPTYRLRIAQHSDQVQRYSLVVVHDRGGDTDDPREELAERSIVVPPGETVEESYRPAVSELRSESRLWFLLYRGAAPRDPDVSSSHRMLRVSWDSPSG